jgi:hypothetical protein
MSRCRRPPRLRSTAAAGLDAGQAPRGRRPSQLHHRSFHDPRRMKTGEWRDVGSRPEAAADDGPLLHPVRPEVSKGRAEARLSVRPEVSKGWAEVSKPWHCWPRLRYLSPNGDNTGLRYLSPNGFFANLELRLRAANARLTVWRFTRGRERTAAASTCARSCGRGAGRAWMRPSWPCAHRARAGVFGLIVLELVATLLRDSAP